MSELFLAAVMVGFLLVSLALFCIQARKEGVGSPPFHFAFFTLTSIFWLVILVGVMGLLALFKPLPGLPVSPSPYGLMFISIGIVVVVFPVGLLGAHALLLRLCLKGGKT